MRRRKVELFSDRRSEGSGKGRGQARSRTRALKKRGRASGQATMAD